MINPDMKNIPLYHNKSAAVKKASLNDVQNDNRSFVDRKPNGDAVKVSGSKRLPPHQQTLINSDLILANVRRRFEAELGTSRIRDNWDKSTTYLQSRPNVYNNKEDLPQETKIKDTNPALSSNSKASGLVSPKVVPSDPVALCKPGNNGFPAVESNGIKVEMEFCPVNTEVTANKWQERFAGLQKFLNSCDDASGQRDYARRMKQLPPAELSKHAVELENRAIQLIIDEGKEVQRMKDLNILGKE
ncbi:uncharacterized protein LOC124931693 [Impatiens glandulifera]|uniref:uncharacterized protein LOC124931693 n=1 Tax=Impatiens glandulifera TaxID=253017 RepID=UPI001FB100CE|nr:uncharacterized protein LOC124931693 [Impatiens glandulifera]XP_047328177.1 uncharacterized protein LOC124931693 [Impatiens glandulifera]